MNTSPTPDGIVTFSDGLPGFEACRRFVIVAPPDLQPFTVMQGIDLDGPAFVAIDPRAVDPEFRAALDQPNLARLSADDDQTLLWLAIVASHEDGRATANLRAPVVINPDTMQGIQVIAVESPYPVDHPLKVA